MCSYHGCTQEVTHYRMTHAGIVIGYCALHFGRAVRHFGKGKGWVEK